MSHATVLAEIRANFDEFSVEIPTTQNAVQASLAAHSTKFLESYQLLCAFRSVHEVVTPLADNDSLGFFIEAHNDLLTAHVHAMYGMWRSALKSLRSAIENTLRFIYYKDHKVELQRWLEGSFRIEPRDLRQYCADHPLFKAHPSTSAALVDLAAEYATLSIAVHAARVDFRMTAQSSYPSLSTDDVASLGQWLSRHKKTTRGLIILFAAICADSLRGAAHRGVRQVMATALSANQIKSLKADFSIVLK